MGRPDRLGLGPDQPDHCGAQGHRRQRRQATADPQVSRKGLRFVGAVREEEEPLRKLAAIFAADVEGYSRLMGQDEVGTLRRLTACRAVLDERIAAFRGRIFGSAGDSVIADFASAVDAVQCALAVQEALATEEQMRFRIGVHVGDVIVQGDNLFGDGVNIAARLEALAAPGGICISGAVRDQIGTKLPLVLADLGEQRVKNIAQPIRAYRVGDATASAVAALSAPLLDQASLTSSPVARVEPQTPGVPLKGTGEEPLHEEVAAPSKEIEKSKMPRLVASARLALGRRAIDPRHAATAVGFAAVIVAAIMIWWTQPHGRSPTAAVQPPVVTSSQTAPAAPRLSIVVLPFANLSDDPQLEYFAEGMTDDVTTDLSRISGSFVIARTTAFTYKGKPVDVKAIGRELGVRYVLEGSVRRAGERVEINVQLVDTESGAHVWADRFDTDNRNVAEAQSESTARLARTLNLKLVEDVARRIEQQPTTDLDARTS